MKNKFLALTLVVMLALSAVFSLSGCGDGEYPVEVANFVIEEEPESIVVLDPSAADIISYIGYDIKMVGRSDEVNQEWLDVVPSVGSGANPDVQKIKDSGASIVFADSKLDRSVRDEIEKNNITVVNMSQAKTPKELETNYVTIGKILGGKIAGSNKGADSYNGLLDDMEQTKNDISSCKNTDVLYTVCYLYLEGNQLKMMTSGTYGDMLLSYTGAVNAAVNIEQNQVDVNTLKIANPNFVFYSDDATLLAIKSDPILKNLTSVKSGKTLMVTSDEMNRQGRTAIETLNKMASFMYPEYAKAKEQPSVAATTQSSEQGTTAATSPSGQTETTSVQNPVADGYKIKLDGLSLKIEDENNNVKIMQQRLYDLGYITDKENITGYYGEISEEAVKSFQAKNGIKETGTADNATLVVMFSEDAVKAK